MSFGRAWAGARIWVALCVAALMCACSSPAPTRALAMPRDTVSPLFQPPATIARPTTPTARPTWARTTPAPTRGVTVMSTVFTDTLAAGWGLAHSWDMEVEQSESLAHSGGKSLAAKPLAGEGALFLSVERVAGVGYLREQIAGVRFWLHSDQDGLALSDLAVTVLGSNAQPTFDPQDHSVRVDADKGPFFSETRLYYLGFNHAISPDAWVLVEVWLDELPYDPDYVYLTGIYIKNDRDYRGRFYIDDVQLIGY